MAKRHKHYSGRKKNKNNGSGGAPHGKISHKAKHRRHRASQGKNYPRDSNAWHNSSVPMGVDDLAIDVNQPLGDIYRGRAYISPETIEDYYFGKDTLKNDHSLKYAGLRPHMKRQNTSLSNFRKREMTFVKAKEPYDPSHDMIEKLRAREQSRVSGIYPNEVKSINIQTGSDTTDEEGEGDKEEESDVRGSNVPINVTESSSDEMETDYSILGGDADDDAEITSTPSQYPLHSSSPSIINDNDLFFVDETGDTNVTKVRTVFTESKIETSNKEETGNLEFHPSLVIGKVELNLKQSNNNMKDVVVEARPKAHPFSGYIKSIIRNMNQDSDSEDFSDIEDGIDIENEPSEDEEYLNDLERAITPESISGKESSESSNNGIMESIESLNINERQEDTPQDPEFGFLEEDYIINTSEVRVSNIRLGYKENSYYVESYRLFGDHGSRWIEQELFNDYILNDIGLPEHRLASYLKHIKDSLIRTEETPEPTFSDIPFSDTSDDGDDVSDDVNNSDIPDDMMEGLDDLVSYSLKYNDTRSQEFESHALQTIGKGKKKRFLINEDIQLDGETIQTLQDKLQKRTLQKAKKRRTKEDFISEENMTSKDLLKKYPYGLHVQNIKDELELFLKDASDSLSFPPLDPHGNKTVSKFANHYNMKAKKSGRGNKQHIIIQKTKKTRWGTPNYNLISQLLKQRPIFMRVDVARTSEVQIGGRVIRERVTAKASFNVREGELVGEDAPEIGKENIGRRLLEKLGWSSGEGLGAHGNKGISEPVLAVVKKNKKGLGHQRVDPNGTQKEDLSDSPSRYKHSHHGHKRRSRARFN